jgi:hypothetical protein
MAIVRSSSASEARPDMALAELQVELQPLGHRRRALDDPQRAPPDRPQAQKGPVRAAEQDRPDVAGKRRLWRAWQRIMDPSRFVFLDETGTATNMARRYCRSP